MRVQLEFETTAEQSLKRSATSHLLPESRLPSAELRPFAVRVCKSAGISIVTASLPGEYLVACIVILMLSGGALEEAATRRAPSVLRALARRMPQTAHQLTSSGVRDVSLSEIQPGDRLVVLPHETCPVDGFIIEGHGSMDESYLTGEPFDISKAPGRRSSRER